MTTGRRPGPRRSPSNPDHVARYCRVRDFKSVILADGGRFKFVEVLGDLHVVKVRASAQTLSDIAALPGCQRIPASRLDDALASLNAQERLRMRQILEQAGYTLVQIQARFPLDLTAYTVGDVLRFLATHRRKRRYDSDTNEVICDGELIPCASVDALDMEVAG